MRLYEVYQNTDHNSTLSASTLNDTYELHPFPTCKSNYRKWKIGRATCTMCTTLCDIECLLFVLRMDGPNMLSMHFRTNCEWRSDVADPRWMAPEMAAAGWRIAIVCVSGYVLKSNSREQRFQRDWLRLSPIVILHSGTYRWMCIHSSQSWKCSSVLH